MADQETAADDKPVRGKRTVSHSGQDLPIYQRFARGCGEPLWAAAQGPDIKIAAVFDYVDADTGPHFHSGHARLDDEEATKVAGYLYGGEPLLMTTARMDDVMDTARAGAVPTSFRTDGTWIWTDASSYYVDVHHLEPDPGLLARIRDCDYTMRPVNAVAVHRALEVLDAAVTEESAWSSDDSLGGDAGPGDDESR